MIASGADALASWSKLAKKVGSLAGWRRAGAAFLAGGLAAAALPPVYILPALLISFPIFLWLIQASASWKQAFGDGWWFGFGHFIAGLYWIGFSLLVDAARFAWLYPFAVLCIPAVLALYTGLVAVLVRLASAGVARVVALAAVWTLIEGARGLLFTGFPWNSIGLVWTVSDATMQFAAMGGMYGLSFLTVLVAASPGVLVNDRGGSRMMLPALSLIFVGLLWAGGAVRLAYAETGVVPGVFLRIVQPNIAQALKWHPDYRDKHLATFLRLSSAPAERAVTHIIWPETAVPFIVASDTARRRVMASIIRNDGLLLTGAVRTTPRGTQSFRIWNSFHAINNKAEIVATYDKFHLVPFGEYVPFRRWLGITKLTAGRTDFSAGPGPKTLKLSGLPPFSPLICYEVVFPDRITESNSSARWLLNVTNDAWFGASSGPYQHFAMARLRSVEQGLPLVRAANTGISGTTDAYGRIIGRIGLNEQGVVDTGLPLGLVGPTLFSRFGSWPIFLFAALSFLLIIRRRCTQQINICL
ncbi:MAG: apolipoprotein N-acyltransferase [Proteobacteria bacterium]|nr:apolipoprotein N-acyltransferase [Pseudomonadota bacterium]